VSLTTTIVARRHWSSINEQQLEMTVNQLASTLLQTRGYYSVRHSYLTLHCSAVPLCTAGVTIQWSIAFINGVTCIGQTQNVGRRASLLKHRLDAPSRTSADCSLLTCSKGLQRRPWQAYCMIGRCQTGGNILHSVFSNGASAFMTCKVISQSLLWGKRSWF